MKWQNNEVIIKKSSRKKTMNIVVERNGCLSVLVPEQVQEKEILDVLNFKEYEITKKIIKWQEANENKVVRRYVNGQSFMYLGKNYSLHFIENQRSKLLLKGGKFLMSSNSDNPRQEFINFYKKQAKIKIIERFELYKNSVNVKPQKVDIRDIQNRWGSCTTKNEIFYHWKCIMAPINVIDYLIVHELCHLEHSDHSREFWHKVSSILPDYEAAKTWLTTNGVKLTI